ncbi:MAG TPA: alpha/beta fold hydrolase [Gemmatimonadota bacterium]|nr:alpha/beta fold hydrolase [Gemmatimonadota bacterium]
MRAEPFRPFRPAWWLPGPHLQTLWSRVLRRGPRVPLERETWATPDGDELALDWLGGPSGHCGPSGFSGASLLLGLHGLEGCSRSLYMLGLLDLGRRHGWRGLALNFRSCTPPPGSGPRRVLARRQYMMNRGRRLYHSGETQDLDGVVRGLIEREPGLELVLVGVSLGGNVLLKWLGEMGADVPDAVRAAATISVPYDLAAASRYLESGLGPRYVRYFIETLKEKALRFDERHPGIVDVEGVRRACTFREIDDSAIAPIHGFADADDYYARSSSIDYVDRIRVPTLLVSAADDPFLPARVLSEVERRASDAVTCEFTARGGHAGFVAGPPWRPRTWAEERAIAFLAEHAASRAPGADPRQRVGRRAAGR